jgi:hypothetical protein
MWVSPLSQLTKRFEISISQPQLSSPSSPNLCYLFLPDFLPLEVTMLSIRSLLELFVFLCLASLPNPQKDNAMTQHATGTFEVKVAPLDPAFKFEENPLTRFSLDKQFHGDLDATSKGEMLAAGNPAKGSGGYVAMERVAGTLQGRSGTFALQHIGTMANGEYHLDVSVVPGSGTGQLTGLSGTMKIIIEGGKHSYDFAYTLPEAK